MSTKERLAEALRAIGQPEMAEKAATGYWDDYESPLRLPLHDLVACLRGIDTKAAHALAERVIAGDYDGTKEEADAWFEREGRTLLRGMLDG